MNAAGISPNMFPRPLRTPTLSLGVSLFVRDSMSAAHTKDKPLWELGAGAAAIAFKANYDEHCQTQYGFLRPIVDEVVEEYLKCGDSHEGFARCAAPTQSASINLFQPL